jgi:enterochelin esterase family protein
LNPTKHGYASLLELPGAPPQPWIQTQPDAPKGAVHAEKIRSAILKEERTLSIYTPASDGRARSSYGLLVLFDGEAYRNEIPTTTILDNLLAAQRTPPLVALLVDSGKTRDRDLQCSSSFADFLAQELLPWARQRYRLSPDPEQVIVAAAACCAISSTTLSSTCLPSRGNSWAVPPEHQFDIRSACAVL